MSGTATGSTTRERAMPVPTAPGGLVNLRDAGALPGAAARLVRPGVLLRSDAPLPGDPEPEGVAWPPGTVIDLRDQRECGDGPHPLAAAATRVEALPLASRLAPDLQARVRAHETSLPALYAGLVDTAGRWVPDLVRIAARGPGPLLVHCAAGKDRTGVTVAVLLAVAGVPREMIVDDYRATDRVVAQLAHRMRTAHPHRPEVPEHLLDTPRAAIEAVLDRIGPDPVAWCLDQGADPDDVVRWQCRIWPEHPWW